jgi:transposase
MDGIVRDGTWRGADERDGEVGAGGRRRRWPEARKAAIVAESFAAGAKVSEVAARHGVSANMLSAWRGQAVAHLKTARIAQKEAAFVPVTVTAGSGREADASPDIRLPAGAIEIVLAGASIRVAKGFDTATLSRVLSAVRSGR